MKKTSLVGLSLVALLALSGCGGGGGDEVVNGGDNNGGAMEPQYPVESPDNGNGFEESDFSTKKEALVALSGKYEFNPLSEGDGNELDVSILVTPNYITMKKNGSLYVRDFETDNPVSSRADIKKIYAGNVGYTLSRLSAEKPGWAITRDSFEKYTLNGEELSGETFTVEMKKTDDAKNYIPDGVVYMSELKSYGNREVTLFWAKDKNAFYLVKEGVLVDAPMMKVSDDDFKPELDVSKIANKSYTTNFGGTNASLILNVDNKGLITGTGTNMYEKDLTCTYTGTVKDGEAGYYPLTIEEDCGETPDNTVTIPLTNPILTGFVVVDAGSKKALLQYSAKDGLGELILDESALWSVIP